MTRHKNQWSSLVACGVLCGCHAVTGAGDYEVARIVGKWQSEKQFEITPHLEARADLTGVVTYPVDMDPTDEGLDYRAITFDFTWAPGEQDNDFIVTVLCTRICPMGVSPSHPLGPPAVCTTPNDDRLDCPLDTSQPVSAVIHYDRVD